MARTDRNSQRHVPLALFAVAAILLVARFVVPEMKESRPRTTGLVKWVTAEEGMALARTSNRPLLLDFTADWCQPCHELDAQVFSDPRIAQQINERFIPVRIVDRQREEGRNTPLVAELERRFNVRAFPTVIVADARGERARMEGFNGRGAFESLMESAR